MQIWTWLAIGYAAVSIVTFAAYGVDKRRAIHGRWRISETTLHCLELLGGWPGAILGQVVFRHKLAKPGYMLIFMGIIGLHVAAWLARYYLAR